MKETESTKEKSSTKKKEEFDRSVCFMFFESYLESAEKFQKQFGTEVAFNYLTGLAKYALYQEESEDALINALVSGLKNTIDSGQEKRSKGFSKEDFEQTKLVAEYHRDHPEASQRQIVEALNGKVKKTKVQKTLSKIKESGMSVDEYIINVINPNLNNNTNNNINTNINSNNNSETTTTTSRESPSTELADAQTNADAQKNAVAQESASLFEKQYEEVVECFKKGMSYKSDNPQIQRETGIDGDQVYRIIEHYKKEQRRLKSILPDKQDPEKEGIETDFDMDIDFKSKTLDNNDRIKHIIKVKIQDLIDNQWSQKKDILEDIVDDMTSYSYQCDKEAVKQYVNGILDTLELQHKLSA